MNVRKFWFVNANNVQYNLTDVEIKTFLSNPIGLGFQKELTIDRLGNQAKISSNVAVMPQPSGELLFYKDANAGVYGDYYAFIQFAKLKPLRFYYQTPNSFEAFYIDCEILSLDKSEISNDGILRCPITIQGLSFWKNANEHILKVEEVVEGGKIYPFVYPYTYEGNSFAHIDLQNNGTLDCGFTFEINDEITNPVLSLFQNDIKYGEIRIDGTYDKIVVDTRDSQQYIYLEHNGSAIANPTSKFILTGNGEYATPFPKLKEGQNVLTFSFGGIFTKAVYIKWNDVALTI